VELPHQNSAYSAEIGQFGPGQGQGVKSDGNYTTVTFKMWKINARFFKIEVTDGEGALCSFLRFPHRLAHASDYALVGLLIPFYSSGERFVMFLTQKQHVIKRNQFHRLDRPIIQQVMTDCYSR